MSLFSRFDYTDNKQLFTAIIRVRDAWHNEKRKPPINSDQHYMCVRLYRPVMVSDVTKEWSRISGREVHKFPFNDDYVSYCWMAYRKENRVNKLEIRRQLGLSTMFPEGEYEDDSVDE
jgi:hypothetical protein